MINIISRGYYTW